MLIIIIFLDGCKAILNMCCLVFSSFSWPILRVFYSSVFHSWAVCLILQSLSKKMFIRLLEEQITLMNANLVVTQ